MRGITTNQVSTRISGPGPGAMEFILGMVIGVVFAPAIIAVSKSGAEYLKRLAEERLRK